MKRAEKPPVKDKGSKPKTYSDRTDAAENKQVQRKKIFSLKAESKDVNPKDGMRPVYTKEAEKIVTPGRLKAQKRQGLY